jgi:hypothetical protein
MKVNKEKIKLGPCKVIFDYDAPEAEQTVFAATQGGVVLTYSETRKDTNIDQFGSTPVKRTITGKSAEVKIPFAEYDIEVLNTILPGSKLVVNASDPTKRRLDVKAEVIDLLPYAKKLVLIPLTEGTTPEEYVTLFLAAPQSDLEYTYNNDNERITNATFVGFPDDEKNLIGFGDPDA